LASPSHPCGHPYHRQYSALQSTPGPNSVPASRSERLILLVKYGACVQHDKRDDNGRSLIDADGITIVQNPIRLRPISIYPSASGYFHIISQVTTYISQVTENHSTSTVLSSAKHITRTYTSRVNKDIVYQDRQGYNAATVANNSYNLMHQS
jgi:hypothetical protein